MGYGFAITVWRRADRRDGRDDLVWPTTGREEYGLVTARLYRRLSLRHDCNGGCDDCCSQLSIRRGCVLCLLTLLGAFIAPATATKFLVGKEIADNGID